MTDGAEEGILRVAELAQTCDDLLAGLLDIGESIHVDVKGIHARLQALGTLLRSSQHIERCGWFQTTLQDCRRVLSQLRETANTWPVSCTTDFLESRQPSAIGHISALADIQNSLSLALCSSIRYVFYTIDILSLVTDHSYK